MHVARAALFLVTLAGCNAPLNPCPKGEVRGWCLMEVTTACFDFNAASHPPPVVEQTAVTSCVPGPGMSAAISIVLRVTNWLRANYTSRGGLLDFVEKDGKFFSAKFVTDAKGNTLCDTVSGDVNPYKTKTYVNLDANAVHDPEAHPETSGAGGGSASNDCEVCLADAGCTDMQSLSDCINLHCAALCPDMSTCAASAPPTQNCAGAGAACGPAVCCDGLSCYASDTGATMCE